MLFAILTERNAPFPATVSLAYEHASLPFAMYSPSIDVVAVLPRCCKFDHAEAPVWSDSCECSVACSLYPHLFSNLHFLSFLLLARTTTSHARTHTHTNTHNTQWRTRHRQHHHHRRGRRRHRRRPLLLAGGHHSHHHQPPEGENDNTFKGPTGSVISFTCCRRGCDKRTRPVAASTHILAQRERKQSSFNNIKHVAIHHEASLRLHHPSVEPATSLDYQHLSMSGPPSLLSAGNTHSTIVFLPAHC